MLLLSWLPAPHSPTRVFSAEDDVEQEEGPKSRQAPLDTGEAGRPAGPCQQRMLAKMAKSCITAGQQRWAAGLPLHLHAALFSFLCHCQLVLTAWASPQLCLPRGNKRACCSAAYFCATLTPRKAVLGLLPGPLALQCWYERTSTRMSGCAMPA